MFNNLRDGIVACLMSVIIFCGIAQAQLRQSLKKTGEIIFITPQNIYVKFSSTAGINAGDTLFTEWEQRQRPVIVAKYMSSQSCAGPIIGKNFLKVGDRVFAYVKGEPGRPEEQRVAGRETDSTLAAQAQESKPITVTQTGPLAPTSPRLYGGITASSFSNFSNYTNSADIQRWNYSLNLNADNIGGSEFYFVNYMNYSYLGSQWKQVTSSPLSSLRVYNLALAYKSSDYNLWLGRYINYNIAGVGPVDGLQGDARFGDFSVGGVAGFRPDFYTLGFNANLFQFGAYVSKADTLDSGVMTNTIGVFQQFNSLQTDRRFLYFQHTSSPFRNFNLYGSGEADIFSLQNGRQTNGFSLTNLYFSAQYSPIDRLSLDVSYSGQRNVIYYQTFGTTLDSLLESQNYLRNNVRFEANVRPFPYTFVMLGTGYSFQQGDISPTRDAEITVTQSNIPLVSVTISASYNRIISNYLDGDIYGITLSKYLRFNSTSISVGVLRLDYGFGSAGNKMIQYQPNANVTTQLLGNLYLNLYYQGTYSGPTSYGTFMGGITERF